MVLCSAPEITYRDYTFPTYDMKPATTSQSKTITLSGYTVIGGGLISTSMASSGAYKTVGFSASVSATTATWTSSCAASEDGTIYANSQKIRVWYYKT